MSCNIIFPHFFLNFLQCLIPLPIVEEWLEALLNEQSLHWTLTRAGSRLPLQTLPVGEGDDVGVGVHAAPGAAAPHALHAAARAVGARGPQGARPLARPRVLIGTNWKKPTRVSGVCCSGTISIKPSGGHKFKQKWHDKAKNELHNTKQTWCIYCRCGHW